MKIVLKIGYIGTGFGGFQKQKNNPRTIQGLLEAALGILFGCEVKVFGAGRTDKGVHSVGQMVHFTPPKRLETKNYPYILNNMLPEDLRVYEAYEMEDDFHVRYSAIAKKYIYSIDCNKVPLVKEIPFALHYPYPLDLEKIKRAGAHLLGTHDFSAFASTYSSVEDRTRTIYSLDIEKDDRNLLKITIVGNGFLHNMVRIIAGTLIDIGRGKLKEDIFIEAFETGNRKILGKTAKAKGLSLEEITYKGELR